MKRQRYETFFFFVIDASVKLERFPLLSKTMMVHSKFIPLHDRDKHSSLLCRSVSAEEKKVL